MRIRLSGLGVTVVSSLVLACGEPSQPLPPGPGMQVAALPSGGTSCDFKAINKLVTSYFSGPEVKDVKRIVSQMQDASADSTRRDRGFDVMTHIASNVDSGNPDFADASSLTNGLLVCMFSDTADLPATFPDAEDFTIATDPVQHGAYAVRGGATDPDTTVVFSRPLDHPFSGIAPPPGTTWPQMLSGNPAPHRVLLYGMPGSHPKTYDWRVVPRSAVFDPAAIVAVCVDPFAETTSLVNEESVGLLPFVNALFMDLSTCSPVATAPARGPLQFARGAVRWGIDLFAPRPLSASSAVFVDGLGGRTDGIHSEFGPEQADTVILKFVQQPSDVRVGFAIAPPVVVQATNATTGATVANDTISLTATDNNGVPAVLQGTLTQVTNSSGLATFADLSETKTGGYRLIATGSVGGRPAIFVVQATSQRFNVRP